MLHSFQITFVQVEGSYQSPEAAFAAVKNNRQGINPWQTSFLQADKYRSITAINFLYC